MVQFPQRAVSVDEVGGSEVMEGLECQRAVSGTAVRPGFTQLPLIHINGQGLLAWKKEKCEPLVRTPLSSRALTPSFPTSPALSILKRFMSPSAPVW